VAVAAGPDYLDDVAPPLYRGFPQRRLKPAAKEKQHYRARGFHTDSPCVDVFAFPTLHAGRPESTKNVKKAKKAAGNRRQAW
jgi:hypothetical protein